MLNYSVELVTEGRLLMKRVLRFKRRAFAREAFKNLSTQAPGEYSIHKTKITAYGNKLVLDRIEQYYRDKNQLCENKI